MLNQVVILDTLLKIFSFKNLFDKDKIIYLLNNFQIFRFFFFLMRADSPRKLVQLSTAQFQLQNLGITEVRSGKKILSNVTVLFK